MTDPTDPTAQTAQTAPASDPPSPWQATILTLFPDMFPGPLGFSLAGRALGQQIWALNTLNIRDFATDKHHSVDDTPAGGGAGMVMRADVVGAALESLGYQGSAKGETAEKAPNPASISAGEKAPNSLPLNAPLLYLSPRGKPLSQSRVKALATGPGVTVLCGRFEGLDERVITHFGIEEVSIGDYVLSGGEPAALVLLDAVIRLLPGVLGAPETLAEESFEDGLLEYPHFTRPAQWQGKPIPDVLTSGHHGRIAEWRQAERERITKERRPDLWRRYMAEEESGKDE
ncbi:MAG: tRNA (guanosine(37)-N1)-methyltransferase TrmD [Alphaproteobacteria bacterium]